MMMFRAGRRWRFSVDFTELQRQVETILRAGGSDQKPTAGRLSGQRRQAWWLTAERRWAVGAETARGKTTAFYMTIGW